MEPHQIIYHFGPSSLYIPDHLAKLLLIQVNKDIVDHQSQAKAHQKLFQSMQAYKNTCEADEEAIWVSTKVHQSLAFLGKIILLQNQSYQCQIKRGHALGMATWRPVFEITADWFVLWRVEVWPSVPDEHLHDNVDTHSYARSVDQQHVVFGVKDCERKANCQENPIFVSHCTAQVHKGVKLRMTVVLPDVQNEVKGPDS